MDDVVKVVADIQNRTAFLESAARYFENRNTGGEDRAHWSNVFNAKNCREIADLLVKSEPTSSPKRTRIMDKACDDCCRGLLSEGLDLCVRARKLDDAVRATMMKGSRSGTRSATMALWVLDQYESDVANWEKRARHHLTQDGHS